MNHKQPERTQDINDGRTAIVRIDQTLRTTPATAAGVSKRLWELSDIVDVLESWEAAKSR